MVEMELLGCCYDKKEGQISLCSKLTHWDQKVEHELVYSQEDSGQIGPRSGHLIRKLGAIMILISVRLLMCRCLVPIRHFGKQGRHQMRGTGLTPVCASVVFRLWGNINMSYVSNYTRTLAVACLQIIPWEVGSLVVLASLLKCLQLQSFTLHKHTNTTLAQPRTPTFGQI